MACADLCTAAKCAELEQRIVYLEQALSELSTAFRTHTFESIPTAHDFSPDLKVETNLSSGVLTTSVDINSIKRSDSVDLSNIPVKSVKVDLKKINEGYEQFVTVTVNGTKGEGRLSIPKPDLELNITPINESTFAFEITLGDRKASKNLFIKAIEDLITAIKNTDFSISLNNLSGLLTVSLTINGVTRSASTYIGGIGGNNNSGGGGTGDMGCPDLEVAFEDRIELVLQAIAELRTKVVNVEKYVTIDIEGETYEELECPEEETKEGEEAEGEEVEKEYGTLVEYKGKGLTGIHEAIKIISNNLVRVFEASCTESGVVAFPAWYQVRLGGSVPQVVCIFRKAGSSTYHSISIPHPATTSKPEGALLPAYSKGSFQGMVICKDNSKFIINCSTEAEAERMCNAAIGLIDSEYLEQPPRVHIGRRKGQAVGDGSMTPTSIEYYETGQRNSIPDWRVRLTKIEPE